MTIDLYLDYLDPPGSLACLFLPHEGEEEPPDAEKCLSHFLSEAIHLAGLNLQTQVMSQGRMVHGTKPARYYLKEWQKRARPFATVMLTGDHYMLAYPAQPGAHPLVKQGWAYLKAALDLVSDDARDGLIFRDPFAYEKAMPGRLLAAHNKLPKLTFAKA